MTPREPKLNLRALLCLFVAIPALAEADTAPVEQRYRQRLADPRTPPREIAESAIEWSLLEVGRATSAGANRTAHWSRAEAVLGETPTGRGPSDFWLLLRLQAALNLSTRGELEQAVGDDTAVATLRAAAKRLGRVSSEIEALSRSGSGELSRDELASLANRTTLARAEAERLLAMCHPAGSPDRDDALLQSAKFAAAIVGRDLPADLFWRTRLLLVGCERLLGDAPKALARLDDPRWRQPATPNELAGAVAAERWRLLRAVGREREAARLLDAPQIVGSAELDLAKVEAMTLGWSTARGDKRDAIAGRVQQALVDGRREHGGLWAARAERIAGETLAVGASGGSVDAIAATAEYLYRTGRLRQAVEAYDRAAGVAYREGATGRTYELARTAAAIVRSQGDLPAAAKRFRRAALSAPRRADAASTHRLAILALAEALKSADANRRTIGESYGDLLTEHLATWPEADTIGDARWWLAKWRAATGEWRDAIEGLATILSDDPHFAESVGLLGDAYLALAEDETGDARRQLLVEATARLQPIITGADNRWPTTWSELQRETALVLAKLHGGEYARRLLTTALDTPPPPPDATWRDKAVLVLVPAIVDGGDFDDAKQRLAKTPIVEAKAAEQLLQSLDERLTREDGPAVAALMLEVIRAAPTGDDQGRWKAPYAASALTTMGRADQAIAVYEQLIEQHPRDAQLRLAFARSLVTSGRPEQVKQATGHYAQVEQTVTKNGAAWWDARVGRLRALIAADQRDKAAKLLRLTRVLHPNAGEHARELAAIETLLSVTQP